jgi:hypothetical protein
MIRGRWPGGKLQNVIGNNMKLYFLLIIFISYIQNEAHVAISKHTIPLKTNIQVLITEIDTSTLQNHTIYYFTFRDTILGSFLTDISDKTFSYGKAVVQLCEVTEIKSPDMPIRGLRNGLDIYQDSVLIKQLNFSPDHKSPTLQYCLNKD